MQQFSCEQEGDGCPRLAKYHHRNSEADIDVYICEMHRCKECVSMESYEIRTAAQALCYMTECALATVEDLEGRKRSSKSDIERAKSIAKFGVETCLLYCNLVDATTTNSPRVRKEIKKYLDKVKEADNAAGKYKKCSPDSDT